MKRVLLTLVMIRIFTVSLNGQDRHRLDSLWKIVAKKSDTARVNTLMAIADVYKVDDILDSMKFFSDSALSMATRLGFRKGIANGKNYQAVYLRRKGRFKDAEKMHLEVLPMREQLYAESGSTEDMRNLSATYNNLSLVEYSLGNYSEAMKYGNKSLEMRKLLFARTKSADDENLIASTTNNIGLVYFDLAKFPEALSCYLKALEIYQRENDVRGLTMMNTNIGNIYLRQRDYDQALKYEMEALRLQQQTNNKKSMANILANIGNIYHAKKMHDEARKQYDRALALRKEVGDLAGVAASYGHIANLYLDDGDYKGALEYHKMALAMADSTGDKSAIAIYLYNLGLDYSGMKDNVNARRTLQQALDVSVSANLRDSYSNIYGAFAKLDSAEGKFRDAFEHYKLYMAYRDSVINQENAAKIVQSQMQFNFDAQTAKDRAEQDKKDALTTAEQRRQQLIIWIGGAGLMLVLIFAVFIFRSNRQKQRANLEISRQKDVIEEKQKEIIDSIHYAKRIQQSLLPTEKYIEKNLPK